jgi:nucleoside-diphosphate-sugar epimerase
MILITGATGHVGRAVVWWRSAQQPVPVIAFLGIGEAESPSSRAQMEMLRGSRRARENCAVQKTISERLPAVEIWRIVDADTRALRA